MNKATKITVILIVVLVVIGAVIASLTIAKLGRSSGSMTGATYTVERGPLSINLTETGTIKSRDQHIVKSQVEGRTSIIYVIDEGAVVKEGDLLVELDSSTLQDRLVDQQIQVENTEADYISTSENLEVVKIQSQSNIARAELDDRFAQEDKVKYINGEWPKILMESETELTLAKEDLKRATDEFEWSKKLYEEQYLSETEFRADELALKRSELQVALANEKLDLLNEYTHPRRLTELDSDINQKQLALQRVQRESSSDLVQAQARLRARGAELNRQKSKLAKIEDQISKTKMFAPADGMVVYATSSEFSWRGDTQPLDEGQEVRERQELIHLPTADSMMVVIRVHESALGKVKLGQSVQISVDALPGRSFTGKVTRIAPLPDAASVFMNPDLKVYDTQIMIDGVFPKIRTGMSCKATILIEDHYDALSVPLQAVVGRAGETVVYVRNGSNAEPRIVVTGLDNTAMVHILSGIDAGDEVLLTPPLGGDPFSKSSAHAKGKRPAAPSGEKPTARQSGQGADQETGQQTKRPTSRPSGTPARSGSSGMPSGKRP